MKKAILGKKVGMTQVFDENDAAVPVTVVLCGPMTVVDKRTVDRNGYSAVVCAYDEVKESKLNNPKLGLFKKASAAPARYLREFRYEDADSYEVGRVIDCSMFSDGDMLYRRYQALESPPPENDPRHGSRAPRGRFYGRELQSFAQNKEPQNGGSVRTRARDHTELEGRQGGQGARSAAYSRRSPRSEGRFGNRTRDR